MSISEIFDVVVVGGGPSGATAAHDLANLGRAVLLIDRAGRIKPCGGAIPPRLIRDFDIPDHLLVARVNSARMVSPSDKQVDMPIDGGFVGMVDRDVFDEWLRKRAEAAGAERRTGSFRRFERDETGKTVQLGDYFGRFERSVLIRTNSSFEQLRKRTRLHKVLFHPHFEFVVEQFAEQFNRKVLLRHSPDIC